ncbi:MAG: glucosyltransferase [Candelina submexicana]|nr:MAG: glucosyltransferase [Candelina submexicana]
MSSTKVLYVGLAAGAYGVIACYWFTKVMILVPEPYLDEVFHVRQAQAYLAHQWQVWDPKITTPPGLYLLSVFLDQIFCRIPIISDLYLSGDPTNRMRSINLLAALLVLPWSIWALSALVSRKTISSGDKANAQRPVCSKPALRETLLAADAHTALNICLFPPLFFFYALYYTDVWSAVLVLQTLKTSYPWFWGIAALCFRQTNIFWVAIFPAGLEVVRTLKRKGSITRGGNTSLAAITERSWKHSAVYDPIVSEACFEDYARVSLSVGVAAIANIGLVFRALIPHLVTLSVFTVFVLRNGGVVLGDKSNHVATIHIPQILYIWPYILFFSFPILYPYLFNALLPQHWMPPYLRHGSLSNRLPRLIITIPALGLILAATYFNTIIHPFTLADNRHYVFYVFRILLRHPAIKYLVAPVYYLCAWGAVTALGGISSDPRPLVSQSQSSETGSIKNKQEHMDSSPEANRTSFVIIWLSTTSLSLITAPLVEPRYFIIPWVIWRINQPMQLQKASCHQLWLETAWFIIVNLVTGYIFLYWGYQWAQEPGKVQRFMCGNNAGYEYRNTVAAELRKSSRVSTVLDMDVVSSSDETAYANIAITAAKKITAGEADRGLLIGGTRLVVAISANKVKGMRALTVHQYMIAIVP